MLVKVEHPVVSCFYLMQSYSYNVHLVVLNALYSCKALNIHESKIEQVFRLEFELKYIDRSLIRVIHMYAIFMNNIFSAFMY